MSGQTCDTSLTFDVFTVTEAKGTVSKAAELTTKVEQTANSTGQAGKGVNMKLEQLRNKILKARQAASNVSARRALPLNPAGLI